LVVQSSDMERCEAPLVSDGGGVDPLLSHEKGQFVQIGSIDGVHELLLSLLGHIWIVNICRSSALIAMQVCGVRNLPERIRPCAALSQVSGFCSMFVLFTVKMRKICSVPMK